MKTSKYIKTVEINNPDNPGEVIHLDIHQVDGGFIGIETSFTEEVANYIANPYQDCELVKLKDSIGNDDEIDPPLEEDELVGFLRILVAVDETSQLLDESKRELLLSGIAKRAGLPPDRLSILFGLAKQCLEGAELYQFQRVLRDEPKPE
jgi:hypothetical protein